uniref:Uncharacterized protein n=1 Tax=Oryza rufipogon TaxID=4529 RepID=A0A0E0QMC6_ORYRU
MAMAVVAAASRVQARLAARLAPRRLLSSGGKVLGEEEKAAENIYIKKMEQEKLEKLARQILNACMVPAQESKAHLLLPLMPKVAQLLVRRPSRTRTTPLIAGAVGVLGASAIAWYRLSKPEKSEEVAN